MNEAFLEEFATRLGMQIPFCESPHYRDWLMLMEWAFIKMVATAADDIQATLDQAARLSVEVTNDRS